MSAPPPQLESLRSKPRRFSLRMLLLAGLVLLILLTMLLVSLSVLELLREAVEREARRSAESTAAALALNPDNQHVPGGTFHTVLLLSKDNALSSRLGQLPEPVVLRLGGRVRKANASRSEILNIKGQRSVVAGALAPDGRVLLVAMPLLEQDRLVQSAQGLVVLYLLLVGLFVLIVGYFVLTRVLVRPVRRLVRAAERVAEGDLETTVRVGGAGEIAELSERFNQMIAAIKSERAKLETALEEQRLTNIHLEDAQERLVRSQRLASIGRLAAGVAHEIGNPLSSALAYLELCQDEDTNLEEVRGFLPEIESATQRIQRIIRELLDYSREQALELIPMSPKIAIQQTLKLLAPQPRLRNIKRVDATPDTLPVLTLDEGRLVQLLLNLCLNAADAMEETGGTLTISAETTDTTLTLIVEDNGPGIPDDVLPHIFEPFFTTKAPGKGTGLGLAICERIAEQLGAELSVTSVVGEGTRFMLFFRAAA